jgi:hypothetical protein
LTTWTQVFGGGTVSSALDSYNNFTLTANLQLVWPQETAPNSNLAAQIIEIASGSTGAFSLTLPPANMVSVGQFLVFNNLSSFTQLVLNNAGTTLLSIAPGAVFFLYLQNNSTTAGLWFGFQYGAAISNPSVAAIAGAGLLATGSTLSQDIVVSSFSISPVVIGINQRAQLLNWTTGSGIFDLPASNIVGPSWYVQLRNSSNSTVSVVPSGSDNINGLSSITLQPGDSAIVVTDGVGDWYTIGLGTTQFVFFNYQAISVTGASNPISLGTTVGTSLNKIAYKFTGTLTANLIVDLPAYAQTYWINNQTTGAFTLTFQVPTVFPGGLTPAGAAVAVAQNTQVILYSDGANVINAVSGTGLGAPVLVAQGGTGATTAGAALTNLGGTSIGVAIFTTISNAAAQAAMGAASVADAVVFAMVF